jgi:hypothetical protein
MMAWKAGSMVDEVEDDVRMVCELEVVVVV